MHSKMKKIFALLLTFVMILGTTPPITFAEPTPLPTIPPMGSPIVTLGNDNEGSTIFYYNTVDDIIFADMTTKSYVKFNPNGSVESSSPDYTGGITLNTVGNTGTWSSNFPIAYVYAKSGAIAETAILKTKMPGNSGGNLYQYPAGTKSGSITTPLGNSGGSSGLSHVLFFYEPYGTISVTKTLDPEGEKPAVQEDFTFKLYSASAPDVILDTLTVKPGETKSFEPVPLGNYIIKEDLSGLIEYSITSDSQNVTLSVNNLTPTLTFMNKYIQKKYEITVDKSVVPIGDSRIPSGQIFKFQLIRKSDN